MKKNMGKLDRSIRITAAVILAILFFTEYIQGTLGIVLMALAVIFVVTSFVNFCPLYAIFGLNTCKTK